MPNPTPAAQVAALAAEVGITPETHRHLFKVINIGGGDDEAEQWKPRNLPDPLGPDADGVWLAPAVKWLWGYTQWESDGCDMYRTDTGGYGFVLGPPIWSDLLNANETGNTGTEALLMTCLAARVPEVCAIFGRVE